MAIPVGLLALGVWDTLTVVSAGFAILSTAILYGATSLMLAQKRFKSVAAARIANAISTALLQIAAAAIEPSAVALLIAYALGSLIGASVAIPSLKAAQKTGRAREQSDARSVRLRNFVASLGSAALVSNVTLALPLTAITAMYGPAMAASFYLARRLLMVPTQLIASSVSEVGYALLANRPAAEVRQTVRRWLKKTIGPACAVVLLGLLAAPVAARLVGSDYPHVALTLALLSVPTGLQLASTSFTNVLVAIHEEKALLYWNLWRLFGTVFVLCLIWTQSWGYDILLISYAASQVLAYGSLLLLVRSRINSLAR
jgi:O-antigen/teichoic acid export membrane protein